MLELSKFFNNDIVSTNQTLKPVILITDPETDNVLFTLTQDKDEILDNQGNMLDIISCISKVSNVRLSTDYDSKKLKINRLRCTLYNYYDVNTKISEYINGSITNKNLFLFYKSPTTNVINTEVEIGDYDCALVYKGEISRIEFNNDNLTITAEDKTQIKIADKEIPYMSIDRLPDVIKNNLTEQYKEDNDAVVPMTFGKVDKAPTVTYYSDDANQFNVLLDTFPTLGKHRTSKIPSMLDYYIWNNENEDYMLYSKNDDDYLIIRTGYINTIYYENYQYNPYSRFVLYSQVNTDNTSYLFPELSQDMMQNPDFQHWTYLAFNIRQAIGANASDGSILGVSTIQAEDISNTNFSNEESLTDNADNPKVWYRQGDSFAPNVNFDSGYKTYNSTVDASSGRWIIFRMEKGASNRLYSIGSYQGSNWTYIGQAGSTWALTDSKITRTNTFTLPTGADRVGWFVAVISAELLGNSNPTSSDFNLILNRLLVQTQEDFDNDNPNMVDLNNPYETAPIYMLSTDSITRSNSGYWGLNSIFGSSGFVSGNFNGYKYGQVLEYNNRITGYNADEEDLIAVFEYFPQNWTNDGTVSYETKLELNNFAMMHQVLIDDLTTEEIYASITGRKNNTYTEQIDPAIYEQQTEVIVEDIPFSYFKTGEIELSNGVLQNKSWDINVLAWKRIVRDDYGILIPFWNNAEFWVGGSYDVSIDNFKNTLNDFIENESWANNVSENYEQYIGYNVQHPAVIKTYSVYKYIFKMFLIQTKILNQLGALRSDLGYAGWKSPPIESAINQMHQSDGNFTRCLWNNRDWIKGFYSYAYEYILQRDIPYEHNYQAEIVFCDDFETYHIEDSNVYGYYKNEDRNTTTINITDKIAEYKQYNWNDFNIVTFGDWIDNFYVYMDDLAQAFSRALLEDYQDAMNENDFIENNEALAINGEWIPRTEFNMEEWADQNQWVLGLGALDTDGSQLNAIKEELGSLVLGIYSEELEEEALEQAEATYSTDGIIEKPSDIVMNILTNELGYGKYNQDEELGNVIFPDYDQYDMPTIIESRNIHNNWKMGFSVDKKIDGKKLIEEILNETKSYPRFKNDGKFGLINIKDSYTRDDIDKTININEIIKYKFLETKREDIITSCKMFYRYDYGHTKFAMSKEKNIIDLLPAYNDTQTHNYHLKDTDGHKDINLKYHTNTTTVGYFLNHKLLNQCNTHNIVQLSMPLSYMDLTAGDIIHIPLINNEKIFDIDYSVVDYKNSQPIYPLWIIMETNIGIREVSIKAYQLHYLGTDGEHGFV